MLCYWTVQWHS